MRQRSVEPPTEGYPAPPPGITEEFTLLVEGRAAVCTESRRVSLRDDGTLTLPSVPPGGTGSEQVASVILSSRDHWMGLAIMARGSMGSGKELLSSERWRR